MTEVSRAYLWLSSTPGIGVKKTKKIIDYFGNICEAFSGAESDYKKIEGINEKNIHNMMTVKNRIESGETISDMEHKSIKFVCIEDELYPSRLKNIYDPPYGLFYRGNLPREQTLSIAVVGARDVSYEGRELAEKFGEVFAANGIQVISGLARGVDIASQKGTMNVEGGRTYAVLGTGIDICYPAAHIEEYTRIQERGGIISEFPMKTPSFAYQFAMRNRIISGLSDGILIIEAKKGSGSLITAETGLEQGREIFVLPGSIVNPAYEGSNELIKNGAKFVTNVGDILEEFGILSDDDVISKKKKTEFMLETTEKIVYAILSLDPVHITEIVEKTGLSMPEVMETLLSLQLKKYINALGNNYFAIRL